MICNFDEHEFIDYVMFDLFDYINIVEFKLDYNNFTYNIWYNKNEKQFISTFKIKETTYYVFDKTNNIILICENIGYEIESLKHNKYHLTVELFIYKDIKQIYEFIGNYGNLIATYNNRSYKGTILPDTITNACKLIGFELCNQKINI